MIFAETYLKYKHLIDAGTFVLIKAMPQPSFRDKEKQELRINEMELLDNVLKTHTNEVILSIKTDMAEDEEIQVFIELIQACEGTFPFSLVLIDRDAGMKAVLHSNRKKIDIEQLLPLLEQFDFVSFELK